MCYLARAARLRAPSPPPLFSFYLFFFPPSLPPPSSLLSGSPRHIHTYTPGAELTRQQISTLEATSHPPRHATPRHAVSSHSTPLDIYIVCRSSRGWKKKVARPLSLSSPCRVEQKDSLFSSSTPSVNLRAALVWGRFRVWWGELSFRLLKRGQVCVCFGYFTALVTIIRLL